MFLTSQSLPSSTLTWRALITAVCTACTALCTVSAHAASTPTDTECLLNWAEIQAPSLLQPAHQLTQTQGTLLYRFYGKTGVYLGTNGSTVLALGGSLGDKVTTLGVVNDFLPTARTAGCGWGLTVRGSIWEDRMPQIVISGEPPSCVGLIAKFTIQAGVSGFPQGLTVRSVSLTQLGQSIWQQQPAEVNIDSLNSTMNIRVASCTVPHLVLGTPTQATIFLSTDSEENSISIPVTPFSAS